MRHTESPTSRATTCLVVDDDEFSIAVLRGMLEQDGLVHVETANSGKRALQVMEKMNRAPDMLICDLNMPDMGGIEFMAHLGKQQYPGSIVLVSGRNIEYLSIARQIAIGDGLKVVGAFTKPLGRDRLLEVLARRMPTADGGEEAPGC